MDVYKSMQNNVFDTCNSHSGHKYSYLFEQWESIPPETENMILTMNMDRINMINSQDHKVPGSIQWGLDTVIDDEDVVLLVSIVYI